MEYYHDRYIEGDIVLLKQLYTMEEADLQGTAAGKLYNQKRGKLGLVVRTGLNYIDVVFDRDKIISRIPYGYLRRVHRPLDAEYAFGIAPGDVIKLNESAITVDYITINAVYFHNMVVSYKITVFCNDGTANNILSIPFTQVTKGPREIQTYTDRLFDLKNLLNSYYGVRSSNYKKQDECICGKQDHMSYGLQVEELYVDEFDTSKEDTKMNTKKAVETNPVYYPIKKVIFNPPATIVFWKDGTKTVVKARGEAFDPEKGLAMAISRHYLCDICNLTRFDGVFKKYLTKETKEK